jgi:hypothetical protein
MQKFNGLSAILENGYYGQITHTTPAQPMNLRFLPTERSTQCETHWLHLLTLISHRRQRILQAACHFPGVNNSISNADVPWVMYCGCLTGAQTAFTMKTYNFIFAGGISSSATTQALLEYRIAICIKSACLMQVSTYDLAYVLVDKQLSANFTHGVWEMYSVYIVQSLQSPHDCSHHPTTVESQPFFNIVR